MPVKVAARRVPEVKKHQLHTLRSADRGANSSSGGTRPTIRKQGIHAAAKKGDSPTPRPKSDGTGQHGTRGCTAHLDSITRRGKYGLIRRFASERERERNACMHEYHDARGSSQPTHFDICPEHHHAKHSEHTHEHDCSTRKFVVVVVVVIHSQFTCVTHCPLCVSQASCSRA